MKAHLSAVSSIPCVIALSSVLSFNSYAQESSQWYVGRPLAIIMIEDSPAPSESYTVVVLEIDGKKRIARIRNYGPNTMNLHLLECLAMIQAEIADGDDEPIRVFAQIDGTKSMPDHHDYPEDVLGIVWRVEVEGYKWLDKAVRRPN